ncbi:MAG: hypothetical protein JRN61_01955 [Nitrososphaerota archaeon]|nr:hypothetical protein [Nitrososphaerota archaeon]
MSELKSGIETIWVRGYQEIDFSRPSTYFVLGVRGSGKSSLLEAVGEEYMGHGSSILDLFGSRDGESLAWLRSPYAANKEILVLHGKGVQLKTRWETKSTEELSLQDLENYDIIISSSPLYVAPAQEFQEVGRLIDRLYNRVTWSRMVYTIVREAANLFYSRLALSKDQTTAKTESTYLIREARHMGIALGLDTLKYTSIDIDIRSVLDYLILKSQGALGLPDDLQWIYSFIDPRKLANMPPEFFATLTRNGDIGFGQFNEVKWHKQERENILSEVGIEILSKAEPERVMAGEHNRLPIEEEDLIIQLKKQGKSLREISMRSQHTIDTVRRVLSRNSMY